MRSRRRNNSAGLRAPQSRSQSAMMLAEAGIRTLDELEVLGAVKAYARVKALRPKFASLNLLWALAAGLEDRDWRELTPDEKSALLGELKAVRR